MDEISEDPLMNTKTPPTRDRLGLALAGGGFRASLFHVGVLHRLAQEDMLRRVEVISCVSGGSIVGALYAILLKRALENKAILSKDDYIALVTTLEIILRDALKKDLRTRLFTNPCRMLMVAFSTKTLSDYMVELYNDHIFSVAASCLPKLGNDNVNNIDRTIMLSDLIVEPGGNPILANNHDYFDVDGYNRTQIEAMPNGSVITKLVLNATSLNTGSRFWFTASELGEWVYGFAHKDELKLLPKYKDEYESCLNDNSTNAKSVRDLVKWIADNSNNESPSEYKEILDSARESGIRLEAICEVDLGLLRLARNSAWRLMHWPVGNKGYYGGKTKHEHELFLAAQLGQIGHQYCARVNEWYRALNNKQGTLWCLIDKVYLYRSSVNLSKNVEKHFNDWTLAKAVAASANFPPIFPTLKISDFYDDITVGTFGLTDGGVYDNLGVMGLINEGCNYLIVSDPGKHDAPVKRVATGRFGMTKRILNILGDSSGRAMSIRLLELHEASVAAERLTRDAIPSNLSNNCEVVPHACADFNDRLNEKVRETQAGREMHALALFRIDSRMSTKLLFSSGENSYNASDLAAIRTDLDAFSEIERSALITQGYEVAAKFIDKWFYFRDTTDSNSGASVLPEHIKARYGDSANGKQSTYPYLKETQTENIEIKYSECQPALKDSNSILVKGIITQAKHRYFRCFYLWWYLLTNISCAYKNNQLLNILKLMWPAWLLVALWCLYYISGHYFDSAINRLSNLVSSYNLSFTSHWPDWSVFTWVSLAVVTVLVLTTLTNLNDWLDKMIDSFKCDGRFTCARRLGFVSKYLQLVIVLLSLAAVLATAYMIGGMLMISIVFVLALLLVFLLIPLIALVLKLDTYIFMSVAKLPQHLQYTESDQNL